MAHEYTTWAYQQDVRPCAAKFVLVALADSANADGYSYPGQKRLAALTGQSERSVRQHLDHLEASGYLKRSERRRKDGSRTSDAYHLPPIQPTGEICRWEPTGRSRQAHRQISPGSPAKSAGHEPSVEPSGEPTPPTPPIQAPRKSTDTPGPGGEAEAALRGLYNEDARKTLKRTDREAYKQLEQASASFKWNYAQKNLAAEVILERRDEALAALRQAAEGANTIKGSAYRYWQAILNGQRKQPAKEGPDSVDELLKLTGATGHHPDHGPFTVTMVSNDGRTLHTDNTPPLPPEEVRSCLTT